MYREKKIAEIREAMKKIDRGDFSEIAGAHEKSGEWLRFLLDELERLEREYAEERAAHNAHVTELCELGKENRKLLEERDKLIEGLRWYAYDIKYMNWPSELWINQGQRAREILKEIGATVE